MAVIPRMVTAVNRTTGPLDAMFDGQPVVIPAGYAVVEKDVDGKKRQEIVGTGPGGAPKGLPLPYFAAEMVKRQNPVMGTEDPEAPNVFDSLVGILEWGDDISHIEQSDALERIDRELLDDEAQSARPIRRGSKRGLKKGGRRYSNQQLKNPGGIRADYND